MSQASTPPDTLSKDDIKTIADVRRSIWAAGFKGLAYGSLAGYGLHTAAKSIQSWSMLRASSKAGTSATSADTAEYFLKRVAFSKNTALLSFLAGGALGGFLFATAAGKNNVHNLHPIFETGKRDSSTRYQMLIEQARLLEAEKERERRRLQRRETIEDRMVHGHGLSDSHGGRWAGDNGK